MSLWICEDFDEPFEQDIRLDERHQVDRYRVKVIKWGTIPATATFNFKINDGTTDILDETITGQFINDSMLGNARTYLDFNFENFVMNPNFSGNDLLEKDYTLKFSSTGYTNNAEYGFMVVKRQFDDSNATYGTPQGNDNLQKALEAPLWVEFFRWEDIKK